MAHFVNGGECGGFLARSNPDAVSVISSDAVNTVIMRIEMIETRADSDL
jgi:hypothetical protein